MTAYDNDGQEPSLTSTTPVTLLVLDNFQRVAIVFNAALNTIVAKENFIEQ